jgi:hypothetical protein
MIADGAGMKCDKSMKSFYSEISDYICPRGELASCSNSRRRKGGKLRRCKEAGMAQLTELSFRDIHDTVFVRSILGTELKRTVYPTAVISFATVGQIGVELSDRTCTQ